MSLKVEQVIKIMDKYAPESLKESYDNVGLMVGNSQCEIDNILIALDCTLKVIDEAIENNCNLIITHHPLIFRKPNSITNDTLIGKKVIKLIKSDINVFSSHTNLDSTPNGINETITKLLNFNSYEIIETSQLNENAGIGRIINLDKELRLKELIDLVKNKLNIEQLRYCGDEDAKLKKIALINGSGQDYFAAAVAKGAQCIITGDTTYHYVSDYNEEGIAVIDAGHFGTEWPAMKIVQEYLNSEIKSLGFNNSIIMSKCSVSPYKFK